MALARLSILPKTSVPVIPGMFVKCFHDYPAVKESSAFIFHSSMKGLGDSTVGNIVLHEVEIVARGRSRAIPCPAMGITGR